ncbi:hypothetical protein RJ641_009708 [Dillenia turbinata]|uniref:non-specific serine/threonine protein kinase n=1 Tax=Dillenia turbinata TaxID=194707 RepID=A0AAN8Z590_9MAGN
MKNFLKKLHITSNQSGDNEGSSSSVSSRLSEGSSPDRLSSSRSHHGSDHKPFSGLSNWLNSVTNRHNSPPSSSNVMRGDRTEQYDAVSSSGVDAVSSSGVDAVSDGVRRDSGSSNSRDPDIEEEFQIQLALELSAREDPEAVQIEAVKQISLGSCPPENTPAEVVAYRYWNYDALSYDDKILDGFYDLYGILNEATSERMPSLVDLQGTPLSDSVSWEAILVNRAADSNLLKLEEKALVMAVKLRSDSIIFAEKEVVQKLASLVAEYMGGPVGDPEKMLRQWQSHSYILKATHGSMVLPLGSLTIGLARHRALLFKVLADCVGIRCRLVKGQQYTGSNEVAMNFIKIDDGREYIVDLMSDPGTLIPSDAAGSHSEGEGLLLAASPFPRDTESTNIASSSSGPTSSFEEQFESGPFDKQSKPRNLAATGKESDERGEFMGSVDLTRPTKGVEDSKISLANFKDPCNVVRTSVEELPSRLNYPYMHARSPSWTEGVSSPAVRRMKVKDVSEYMIDAAKENPQLAQKLHDVLLESGVVAPPNLFTEMYSEQIDVSRVESKSPSDDKDKKGKKREMHRGMVHDDVSVAKMLPPLPSHGMHSKASHVQADHLKPVEGLGLDLREVAGPPVNSQPELAPVKFAKNVPVAAAAAAAAAVVASSMVVAAAKSSADSNLPVAAAATATAAAVVATTAAVNRQYEHQETCAPIPVSPAASLCLNKMDCMHSGGADTSGCEPQGSADRENATGSNSEGEKISDGSAGADSTKSDVALEDVAEIQWDEINLGERIGLGSYGEVYHGEWHGTEVAVKRFLDQDISGESLEEFKSEVRIMKRLRHPNVVLFMGAVTRTPNLSIITEFLPRGSLYRLLHRPNNHLDERRRLRMALDAARGMNYLHNCTPVIVHRDLKSPNLLVDKNWVVKVCDFGLSRMKNSTFLSSRSTAGTAEWMAPEVLRNEPSDEKCDVFSFGVILWELSTMQQPWGGMNPMQVVGAVGFQHRRLDIPDDVDPVVAEIIRKCWQTDPKLRPSFAEIMAALKPLQKPITSSQVPRPTISISRGQERGQSRSQAAQDNAG